MMLYIDHYIWWHQYDERRGGGQQHQHHHQVQFTEYIPVLYIELCTVPVFFGRKYSVSFRHHVISLCTGTVYVRLKLFSGYSNFFKFQPCCIVVLYPFSLKLRKKKALCFDCKKNRIKVSAWLVPILQKLKRWKQGFLAQKSIAWLFCALFPTVLNSRRLWRNTPLSLPLSLVRCVFLQH